MRIVKPGSTRPEWKPIRRDNHYFDCEALCAAGGYALNVQAIPKGALRKWGAGDGAQESGCAQSAAPAPETAPNPASEPAPEHTSGPARPKAPKRLSSRERFAGLGRRLNR